MALLTNDPLTRLAFSVVENKGVYALLLGSGLSRSAQIPTGWEITLDLIRRVAAARGVATESDWATWYRQTTGSEPNYSELLEEIAVSPDERRALLHGYIEPSEDDRAQGRKIPTAAHKAIAQLALGGYVRVIITTNFDRLIENALREVGVEPTIVASVDALKGAEPLTHTRCYVLKLHGDYKDARILNTDQEFSAYHPAYDVLLDRILDEHGLIISGWSGEWDRALRSAMLRAPTRRYQMFWAAVGSPSAGAQELIASRRATLLQVESADKFFPALLQRVETVGQTRQQNPISVDLVVALAKRLLSRPEHKIELDELVATEVNRLLEGLSDEQFFAPTGSFSAEEFRQRVQKYEALSEPLARIGGVLGRWGAGMDVETVLEVLRALHGHAEKVQGGLVVWLGLRSYPAVLLVTAYGLGLLRARRLNALHTLLRAPLAREGKALQSVVETLFLWCWKGGAKEGWQHLEGFDTRKTPLSDHLLEVMKLWSSSFVGVEADFEYLFERFEVFGSLAHFEREDEKTIESRGSGSGDPMVWMPVGRIGWHGASLRRLVEEWSREPSAQELQEAGFANGKGTVLKLFLDNLQRFGHRMSW